MKVNKPLLFIIIAASLLVHSCSPVSGGGYHLPVKTMQKVLLDINIAEAYSLLEKDSLHRIGNKNIDSLSQYYNDIFAHYHITHAQFDQSLDWYKNNPDELDSIYAINVQTVTRWQASVFKKTIDTTRKIQIPKKDTIIPRRVPFRATR